LDVPYPWQENIDVIFSRAFLGFPGVYRTRPTMTVQFAHLFPLWLAQTYATFGHQGVFRLNGVLALISSGIFYGLLRSLVPTSFAVAGTLFLALNPSQVWLARITLTEVFAQLLIWSSLLLASEALKDKNRFLAWWAGAFMGCSALVRIDGLVLVPLLLLSDLMVRIVQGQEATGTLSVWPALRQAALSSFVLAIVSYLVLSPLYWGSLSANSAKIGVAAVTILLILWAATPSSLDRLRRWLMSKTVVGLAGLALFFLTAYAYWIRPSEGLHPALGWLGHHWGGTGETRGYQRDFLANLAQYISPFVVWTGVFGWFVTLSAMMREKRDTHLVVALIVVAGYSGLYLSNPRVSPDHFWAVRRYVPVVIPGFILLATLGTYWLVGRLPRRWSLAMSSIVLLFLTVFTIRADSLIHTFAENRGYFAQIGQLAAKLPRDEVVLAHGLLMEWQTPLHFAFGRRVVPLNVDTQDGSKALDSWAAIETSKGRPVYLLYEGSMRMIGRLKGELLDTIVLSRSYIEKTPWPLPKRILVEEKTVKLYRITGVSESLDYRDINLGAERVWGVEESGFHGQESVGGQPMRWTYGPAKLVVPVDQRVLPKALNVDLESHHPDGTELRLLVSGRELHHGRIPRGRWSKTFRLDSAPVESHVTVELHSDTFVPKDVIPGSEDPRTLGILVRGIRLFESHRLPHRTPVSG
jgi:hypothetical protein